MKNYKCKICGNPNVVNKHFMLCLKHNNIRLHGSKYGKQYKHTLNTNNPLKSSNLYQKRRFTFKTIERIRKDEEIYEKVFNLSDHKCEECGKKLNTIFRDNNSKVLCRYRYSHILPKSLYGEYRYCIENFNNLCFECHSHWEHWRGLKRRAMKIFKKNREKILKLTNNRIDLYIINH